MSSFIWKPSTVNSWKRGPVFLAPDSMGRGRPVITDAEGNEYEGRYINTNEGRTQYVFDPSLINKQGLKISYNGITGDIANGAQSFEGGDLSSWAARQKGSLAGGGRFAPGNIGFGSTPAYLGDEFPNPVFSEFDPVETAPYNFTDPFALGELAGEINRNQIRTNYELGKDLALRNIETELQGLAGFAPAAAALKRGMLSADNEFNQAERLKQVNTALPGVRGRLDAQARRAQAYAEGRLPDEIADRALEVSNRSRAADQSTAAGFGSGSMAARTASELMSAESRVKLSQYGDQLETQNINQDAQLSLAPTSYSDAGQQIKVTPTVDAGQQAARNLSEINNQTILTPTQSLQSLTQQNQFATNLEQQNRQFNASSALQNSQFNAGIANQFSMGRFDYDVGYAGMLAGANQTNINTEVALEQQRRAEEIYKDAKEATQDRDTVGSIVKGGAAVLGIANVVKGVSDLFNVFGDDESAVIQDGLGQSGGSVVDQPTVDSPYGQIPSIDSIGEGTESFYRETATADQGYSLGKIGKQFMNTLGLSANDGPGKVAIGVDPNTGKTVYSNATLAQSNDVGAGSTTVKYLKQALNPLGVLGDADRSTLDTIANASQNTSTLAALTNAVQNKDPKAFTNILIGAVAPHAINEIKDASTRDGATSAYNAYQLYNNWNNMSVAQKTLGMASLGIKAYKYADGTNLAAKQIIPSSKGTPGLNVGQGLNLLAQGYNVYSMTKNWNQLNTIQKLAAGTNNVSGMAQLAKQFGMLGSGTTGAEVGSVTASALNNIGFTATPQLGVGAGTIATGQTVPAGYTAVKSLANGQTVIAPRGTAAGVAETLGTVASVASIGAGAYQVYKGWGMGGARGRANGAIGGSAIAAGLYGLGATNPLLLAGVIGASVLSNSIKTGKSADQGARDSVRSMLKKGGIVDNKYNIQLADGSTFNVGVDGHGQRHTVTDPSKLVGEKSDRKLNAWDVDYTNDLDYAASMGAISLSRLLGGGTSKSIDQVGGQLTNAAIGNIGHGQAMTQGNFSKAMSNLRSFYAKSGITNKADAYKLANTAFAEKRIDESTLIGMHQAFNMMFDNDYKLAQQLMLGRQPATKVVEETDGAINNAKNAPLVLKKNTPYSESQLQAIAGPGASSSATSRRVKTIPTKINAKEANRRKYGSSMNSAVGVVPY